MVELIEDCLDIIFDYLTPVEWIQISEVCQFWRSVVLKQWNKISETSYKECRSVDYDEEKTELSVMISAEVAKKIELHVVEFCNVLRASIWNEENREFIITFGPFSYKVENYTLDHIMEFWAKNATELTELEFCKPPKPELLQLFVQRNEIESIKVENSNDFWRDIPTDGIKTLHLEIIDHDKILETFEGQNTYTFSFLQHFPNLEKLTLRVIYPNEEFDDFGSDSGEEYFPEYDDNYHEIISRILPYVSGIKSLVLNVILRQAQNPDFNSLPEFPNLEELLLDIEQGYEMNLTQFEARLRASCPKLRSLKLDNCDITDAALHSLLSLPNLEKLDLMHSETKFCSIKGLPKMQQLSECFISFKNHSEINTSDLCDAVLKMPQLKHLSVGGTYSQKESLLFTCVLIVVAKSQGKEIDIQLRYYNREEGTRKLTIVKFVKKQPVGCCDHKQQILELNFVLFDISTFIEGVMLIVLQMKEYRLVIIDG